MSIGCHILFGTGILECPDSEKEMTSQAMKKLIQFSDNMHQFALYSWYHLKYALFIECLFLIRAMNDNHLRFNLPGDEDNFLRIINIILFKTTLVPPNTQFYQDFISLPTMKVIFGIKKAYQKYSGDNFFTYDAEKLTDAISRSIFSLISSIHDKQIIFKSENDFLQTKILVAQVVVWTGIMEKEARKFLLDSTLKQIFDLSQGMPSCDLFNDEWAATKVAESSIELVNALNNNRILFTEGYVDHDLLSLLTYTLIASRVINFDADEDED